MPEFRCELKKYRQLKNLTQEQLGQMVADCNRTLLQLFDHFAFLQEIIQ